MSWLLCLLISTLLFLLWFLLQPSQQVWNMGQNIPGPTAWPIVGNVFYFRKRGILENFLHLTTTYGPISRVWLGKDLWIVLSDPNDIAVFLASTKHLNKGRMYDTLYSWLGTKGLLTSKSDTWWLHRKVITPSLHIKILKVFAEVMEQNATTLCNILRYKTLVDEEFDIFPYSRNCILDIICEMVMGIKIRAQELNKTTGYPYSINILAKLVVNRGKYPWLFNDFIYGHLSSRGRIYFRELKIAKAFVHQVIEKHRKTLQEEMKGDIFCNPKSLLDFLLLKSNFTDEEIENEIQTFMFAGLDAVAITLSFCLYSLSQNQDVQEKLYQEIRNLFIENKEKVTYQDYNKLQYLDCVIDETLRMYTTVPLISRTASENITLPSGYSLPEGSKVIFFLYGLHNNEKYFPNPDQFIPERFENREEIKNFSFLPFSAGPRNCIGAKFAKLEMKIIISALLQRYKFLPSRKVKFLTLETRDTLKSLNKHPVRITLRGNTMQSPFIDV